jgi:vitamin B12 transporter
MRTFIGLLLAIHVPFSALAADPDESVTTHAQPLSDARVPSGFIVDVDVQDTFLSGQGVADGLTRIPGVSLQHQSSLGQPVFARIRGGNPRQMTVSLDGYEISAPFGAGFDLGGLTFSGVDHVRVYRGAAAVVNGAGALTGALDLRSSTRKKPGFGTHAGALLGSYGTKGLTVDGDVADEVFALRVSAQARESAGDFDFVDEQGVEHTRLNNGHGRVGVMATGERQLGRRAKGRLTALWDGGTRGAPGPSEFQEQLSRAKIEDQRGVVTGRTDQRSMFEWGLLSIDTHQQMGSQWRSMTYTNPSSLLGNTPILNTSEFSSLSGIAGAAGYTSRLSVRLQYEGTHSEYRADESGSGRIPSRIQAKRTENALAASAEYTTDMWSLMAGARTEIMRGSRDEYAVLPSVGVAWTPAAWLSFRSNVARTYRAPDFDELYLDLETVRGNPNLHSERAWAMDVGPEFSYSNWRMGAAYFENRMESVILFLPVSSTVIEATNLNGVTSRGLETWADWELNLFVSLAANYTLTRSRRDDGSDQVPHQPMHEGRVGTRVRPLSWLDLSAEIHGHSQTNLDNFGNLKAPGWVSVDAGIRMKSELGFSLGVSAQNIVNDLSRIDGLQQPLPGRSVYVSLELDVEEP